MRLITGGLMHETHTFSAEPTPLDRWTVSRGEECRVYAGTNHSLGGVIDGCRELGIELAPTFFALATPSGTPDRETVETLVTELVARIEHALPADGIVLTLHGAMVGEELPDVEAEILRRVRAITGPDLPIAVTLDLHANTSHELVELATIIVGYDTYPHIDLNDRAREAVALLADTIQGRIRPEMAFAAPPLMPVPQAMFTGQPPFKTLFDRAFALEAAGAALSITIAGGFAYADAPVSGMSFIAVTDHDQAGAERIVAELADLAWDLRAEMRVENVPPAQAVAAAIAYPEGPVVLVDVGDNIGGGTPGDGTVILGELLRQGATEATVIVNDPAAVQAAFAAGVDGPLALPAGGKTDRRHGDPVQVRGRVRLLYDGRWTHEGPENAGVPVDNGPIAVVRVDGVNLILTTAKTAPGDLQQLKSAGIDPARQQILVVKAAVRWRGGYAPIMKHHIDV
ncbi:MAG: M81 family metallopeptidase, partial [Chloroflexia bacterium]|nr:M81 family metallopeptidase [Chloroflexia bacterium]